MRVLLSLIKIFILAEINRDCIWNVKRAFYLRPFSIGKEFGVYILL